MILAKVDRFLFQMLFVLIVNGWIIYLITLILYLYNTCLFFLGEHFFSFCQKSR